MRISRRAARGCGSLPSFHLGRVRPNGQSVADKDRLAPREGTRPTANRDMGQSLQARCPHRAAFQIHSQVTLSGGVTIHLVD